MIYREPSRKALPELILFGAMSCGLLAQTFEAASVKPRDPSDPTAFTCAGGPGTKDPILYRCVSAPIAVLAMTAYDVPLPAIYAPEWIANTFNGYDIQAVVPEGSTKDEFRIMLQNLLTERFHLKWHREMREVDSYILTGGRGQQFQHESADTNFGTRDDNATFSRASLTVCPKTRAE